MSSARLALGCARLGSLTGGRAVDAEDLVTAAYESGITFFDTANIYGQGESERILARALREVRNNVTIATKTGQYFPAWMRAIRPLKNALQPVLNYSSASRKLVSNARGGLLPQDFSDHFLCLSVEASLKRLEVECIDVLMLHSPPAGVIQRGEAMSSLERLQNTGKARTIGISSEDIETASLALDDHRTAVIELPLWPWSGRSEAFLEAACRRNVRVFARGAMQDILNRAPIAEAERTTFLRQELQSCLSKPGIDHVIIGISRTSHLQQIVQAVKDAEVV